MFRITEVSPIPGGDAFKLIVENDDPESPILAEYERLSGQLRVRHLYRPLVTIDLRPTAHEDLRRTIETFLGNQEGQGSRG